MNPDQTNKLLLRQIRRKLGKDVPIPEELMPLLKAVSDSYHHYERDRKLLERALDISSIELQDSFEKMQKTNLLLEQQNELLANKNEEIYIKNQQLKSSNEDLSSFAHVVSHDLKEPLRMVASFGGILKKRYHHLLDDAGIEFMQYILNAVDRMDTMVEDLLNFSRAGNQKKNKKWTHVGEIITIAESNLRHRLQLQNGKIIVDHESLPTIEAYPTQLIQLFQNLISNGIKFKGKNDPVVTINYQAEEHQHIFSISDNGIGIEKNQQQKVFEVFNRLHSKDEYEGTGIGLATCKKIVDRLDGKIWVDSGLGTGSTFYVSIPRNHVETPVASKDQISKDSSKNQHLETY